MKRLVSLVLTLAVVIGFAPARGVNMWESEAPSICEKILDQNKVQCFEYYGERIYWQSTEEITSVGVIQDDDTLLLSWCFHNDTNKGYETYIPLTSINSFIEANSEITLQDLIQNIDCFDVMVKEFFESLEESVLSNAEETCAVDSDKMKKNAIMKCLTQKYDTETYSWRDIAYSYKYSPITLRIRESKEIAIIKNGTVTPATGVTIASAATTLAPLLGINVPTAISLLCSIMGTNTATDIINKKYTLEKFTATFIYERDGTVQEPNGKETAYDKASAYYRVHQTAVVDGSKITSSTTDYTDITYLADEATEEYSPDKNSYQSNALF